ncbi:MAG: SRPBCC family protein [Minisyncoccia bacterium]
MKEKVTVEVIINVEREKVWDFFNDPAHIVKWNHASDDWHSPRAENDLRVGGRFNTRMEAKDGSEGFDFIGTYTEVVEPERFAYTMDDGRTVSVTFEEMRNSTYVKTLFDPEDENSIEMQKEGWQAILDNFKKYAESRG